MVNYVSPSRLYTINEISVLKKIANKRARVYVHNVHCGEFEWIIKFITDMLVNYAGIVAIFFSFLSAFVGLC